MSAFDTKILDILVCPKTKKPLTYNKKTQELVNDCLLYTSPSPRD